jgi:putative hemolysin
MLNALFAASEMALVSISPSTLYSLQKQNKKNQALLEKVTKDSTKYLSTIQVAITFSGFLSSAFAGSQLSDKLVEVLFDINIVITDSGAVVLITILLSFFTLVFGELVPKRIALNKSVEIALLCAPVIYVFMILFTPFVWLLTISTNGVVKLFGINNNTESENITEQDIKEMIVYGHIEGLYKEDEKEMMENIFMFDDITVKEIMTPNEIVTWIDINDSKNNILEVITQSKFSRIPVYDGSCDKVQGVIVIKDILLEFYDKKTTDFDLKPLVRDPYYVEKSTMINELFKQMNDDQTHMSFVADENMKVIGIITLEDIIEEIFGEIYDEHDRNLS